MLRKNPSGIVETRGTSYLEVGPGNNFVSHYVSQRNIGVETLDITTETNPTYVGPVTQIPCKEN